MNVRVQSAEVGESGRGRLKGKGQRPRSDIGNLAWLQRAARVPKRQPVLRIWSSDRLPPWPLGLRSSASCFVVLSVLLLLIAAVSGTAEQRFPPPDFVDTNHQLPDTSTPPPRAVLLQVLDVAALAGALGVATWLVHRKRSRRGLFWLGLFSIGYFGFWRKGCVCAIGSPQNIVLGLFDSGYTVPLGVIAFFALPLVFALFVGRTFCSAVCPHGALQDLMLIKPLKVPPWLEQGLSLLPLIILGAGVWLAASGAIFLFCHYDPIVPVFRLNGRLVMVITGLAILGVATVIGRPYCRFLCPYGALLKMASAVSRRRVRVTPDRCTQCRLCEHSCPFGAMREPEPSTAHPLMLVLGRRRLGTFLVALPVLMACGAWLGGQLGKGAARIHPQVALAEDYALHPESERKPGPLTPDELALRRAQENPEPILQAGIALRRKIEIGGWFFGGWVGLVIGVKLISLSLRRVRTDYEPDPGACLACARCFEYCPEERVRRGQLPAERAAPHGEVALPILNRAVRRLWTLWAVIRRQKSQADTAVGKPITVSPKAAQ